MGFLLDARDRLLEALLDLRRQDLKQLRVGDDGLDGRLDQVLGHLGALLHLVGVFAGLALGGVGGLVDALPGSDRLVSVRQNLQARYPFEVTHRPGNQRQPLDHGDGCHR